MITIAIPTYNRGAILVETIERLLPLEPRAYEIIIADQTRKHPPEVEARLQRWCDETEITWLVLPEPSIPHAMNVALEWASSPLVLFLDDDNLAKPHQVATLVAVARRTGADILTSFHDAFAGDGPPGPRSRPLHRRLFLGDAAAVGALVNAFGDTNSLVRRAAFLALVWFIRWR